MHKYSLYLFDFDGTLFDTLDSLKEAYRESLGKFGKTVEPYEYAYFLGLSLPLTAKYKNIPDDQIPNFIDCFHNLIHNKKVVENTKLYIDTLATFKYLNDHNLSYGIVSGSATKRIHDVMEYFNLDYSRLATCVGNDCYPENKAKPHPEPILIALNKTNYFNRKNEVLFIGDAEQDIKCARAAGVDCVIVKRDNKKWDVDSLLDIFKL